MLYTRLIVFKKEKETLLKCFALILKKVFKNRMEESVMKTEASFIKE